MARVIPTNNLRPPAAQVVGAGEVNIEQFFSVSSPSLTEGDSGTKNFGFIVSASRTFLRNVSFDYATEERIGGATEGVDYLAAANTGVLLAGQTEVTVNISVAGDTDVEADEQFDVRFSNFRMTS